MPNMSLKKNKMAEQAPDVRNKNFDEVALGYTEEQAIDEAKRCLNCKNKPCVSGCPVQIDIPAFIAEVAEGRFEEAYKIITKSSSLPAVCGRVCPQEMQCESKCVRGAKGEPVAIGRLERFVADRHNALAHGDVEKPVSNGHKAAVIGSGPSGLACAGDLAKMGYDVTVFEALHLAGGVLVYGIPEFRLPKSIVQKEIDNLSALGVDVHTIGLAKFNTAVGIGYNHVFHVDVGDAHFRKTVEVYGSTGTITSYILDIDILDVSFCSFENINLSENTRKSKIVLDPCHHRRG